MFEKISNSVFVDVSGKTIGNVGIIIAEKSIAIDSSMFPKIGNEIQRFMENQGKDSLGVILTHYHADHSWGSTAFKDKAIIAHEFILENMKNALKERWSNDAIKSLIAAKPEYKELLGENFKPVLPNTIFSGNEYTISDFSGLKLYHVGGHTNGSTIAYYEKEDVLFAGDTLFAKEYPWGGDVTADPYLWINALDLIIELRPKIIIPGHGPVQDSLEEVKHHKMYFEAIVQTGERMYCQKRIDDQVIAILGKIGFYSSKAEERKYATLKQFYRKIKALAKAKKSGYDVEKKNKH